MKNFLAMALTLALVLGLACPALAAAESDADLYAEYEAAHPEEIANLDVDALIAGWGYKDVHMTAREAFLEYYDWYGDTVEEAVKGYYIDKRLMAQEDARLAPIYREDYPDAWAEFDAEDYFQTTYGDSWDKAEYMAGYCLLSQEEFVDDMFTDYIEFDYNKDADYDWDQDYGWDENDSGYNGDGDGEPALTLMVNGEASDVAITARDGVSYADAADLRALFPGVVDASAQGPLPIRDTAAAAGWDVAWYDGSWWSEGQEVQLWDRAAFEGELADEFGPFNDFLAQAIKANWDAMSTQTPVAGHETVDVDLTRFSTLDGDQTYQFKLGLDYVCQNKVLDMTVTFDVAQLLKLMPASTLALIEAEEEAPSLEQLAQALGEGKAECIIDYDRGGVAYNVPFLGLVDPDLAGWHAGYSPLFAGMMDGALAQTELTLVSTLYAQMINDASRHYGDGAAEALADYRETVGTWATFAGKDCFATDGGKTAYTLTTQGVDLGLAKAMGLSQPETASLFKAFEVSFTWDDQGKTAGKAHIRTDVDGIPLATGDSYYDLSGVLAFLLSKANVDITADLSGGPSRASGRADIHVDNWGRVAVKVDASVGTSKESPRQIEDVDAKVYSPFDPDGELDPGFSQDFGIIGGADGPTAIITALP